MGFGPLAAARIVRPRLAASPPPTDVAEKTLAALETESFDAAFYSSAHTTEGMVFDGGSGLLITTTDYSPPGGTFTQPMDARRPAYDPVNRSLVFSGSQVLFNARTFDASSYSSALVIGYGFDTDIINFHMWGESQPDVSSPLSGSLALISGFPQPAEIAIYFRNNAISLQGGDASISSYGVIGSRFSWTTNPDSANVYRDGAELAGQTGTLSNNTVGFSSVMQWALGGRTNATFTLNGELRALLVAFGPADPSDALQAAIASLWLSEWA